VAPRSVASACALISQGARSEDRIIAVALKARKSNGGTSGFWMGGSSRDGGLRRGFAEREQGAASGAARPVDLGFDQAGARADVRQPAPRLAIRRARVEAAPIVLKLDQQRAVINPRAQPDRRSARMAADVVDGFLKDAEYLNLYRALQPVPFVQAVFADEFV